MLHAWRHSHTGELRLYVRLTPSPAGLAPAEAWIGEQPFGHGGTDWVLWVRRSPGAPATREKCQLQLEIESRLRGWLLRQYHRRLLVTSFGELCEIARTAAEDADHVRRRTWHRPGTRRLTHPHGRGV